MQTIYIDISNKNVIPTIYAKQGEVGRKFLAVLTDDSVPYSLPAGYAFSVWYDGDSGEGNYTHIGEKSAFSVDGNKVSVEMIAQMLSVPGEGKMCLVLNYGENQTATWNIEYVVESVPGAESEKAEEYYTAFSQTVSELPYPDESLSVPGKAADAAATGAALASKAPAGFGLGKTVAWIDAGESLSSYMDSGFYSWRAGASDAPFDAGSMIVIGRRTGYAAQLAFRDDHQLPAMAVRKATGSQWTPWEWINPPMQNGVEYRTVRRYGNKPVYCKQIYCGTVAAGTPTAVKYSDDENCRPILVSGGVSSGVAMQTGLFCTVNSSGAVGTAHKIYFGGYMNYITIESAAAAAMQVNVEYYKTTD